MRKTKTKISPARKRREKEGGGGTVVCNHSAGLFEKPPRPPAPLPLPLCCDNVKWLLSLSLFQWIIIGGEVEARNDVKVPSNRR